MNVIIIDDEFSAREILKKMLVKYCPDLKLIGEADSIDKGKSLLDEVKPDLLFLDIHLQKENGFDLLSQLGTYEFEVVFTTAHNHYGVDAFKVKAMDYLLKPIDSDELVEAVNKVKERRLLLQKAQEVIEVLIPVHEKGTVKMISASQVTSLSASDNYTEILTVDKKRFIVSRSLTAIEELLNPLPNFVRIHRNAIVNIKHIVSYSKSEPCFVNLVNGASFEISRRKKTEVLQLLK